MNRVLGSLSLELRRVSRGHHSDAFREQRGLLAGEYVHTIFDVGANVGLTARRYRNLFAQAQIHCFEPFPESHRALLEAFPAPGRVHVHPLAVSDRVGSRTLFVNKASVTNSLFPTSSVYRDRYAKSDITTPTGSIAVSTIRLDEFCSERRIAHINILKLDIQGGELLALRGAERLLASAAIDVIYSEVNFSPIYEGQSYFHDLAPVLLGHGYQLFNLYPLTYARNGVVSWSDALWISRDLERRISQRAIFGRKG